MKQLKKPTKAKNCLHARRFEDVCRLIRSTLHIEHVRYSYIFEEKNIPGALCQYLVFDEGDYIVIQITPAFWNESADWQLRALIHEHCHHVCAPYTQAYNAIVEWVHESDVRGSRELYKKADERVTCHWEGIVYEWLKHRVA